MKQNQFADVICQHKADGTITPLRIRVKGEDGKYQEFNVKPYRDLTHNGSSSIDRIEDDKSIVLIFADGRVSREPQISRY